MLLSAFVDESGTGAEPALMLAGLVGTLGSWTAFTGEWRLLLNWAGVDHFNYFKMRARRDEYCDWDVRKENQFNDRSASIIERYCSFGLTVSLDKAHYKDVYRANFPAKTNPDSAYAVCGIQLIMQAQALAGKYLSPSSKLNFAFESGCQGAGNLLDAFGDIKKYAVEGAEGLGYLTFLDKRDAAGLQAADHIVATGRRTEFKGVTEKLLKATPEDMVTGGMARAGCPVFYHRIGDEDLLWQRDLRADMALMRRRAKASR